MKVRISAYEQKVEDLEGTIKTLSTLVEGNLNFDSDSAGKDVRVKKSPRRRNRRRTGQSREETTVAPDEGKSYSAVLQANEQENRAGSEDEESVIPESMTSQRETDRSTTEESLRDDEDTEEAFRAVNRRRNKKRSINITGDSMVRNVTKIVKCGIPGSGCIARGGAGIKEIVKKAIEVGKEIQDDGYLIIQGGGNSLKWLGVEETVKTILEGVDCIRREKKEVNVAVCSILPRPRESERYNVMRMEVNRKLQEELCMRKANATRRKENAASYLDMDSMINPQMYREDGVHFNEKGNAAFGKKVICWLQEKERHLNSSVR